MSDESASSRREELAAQAHYHVEAQRRAEAQESAKAQLLIDEFVRRAKELGIPTEELTSKPWSGGGRYRTGVTGWYLKRDKSLAVGEDGRYYQLTVMPQRFGRFRRVPVEPTPPPLQVGKGARDGESMTLEVLLGMRYDWADVPRG